jgi:hypothetical protein
MSNIKAFVAHSFLDCDAEVIGKFLKYFEGLSKALPEFFGNTQRRPNRRIWRKRYYALSQTKMSL